MTTEEKARAYDEALKRAKAAIDIAADKDLVNLVKGVATTIFPELRESEDERIRTFLLDYAIEMIAGLESDISLSTYDGIKGHDPDAEAELAQWQKARAYLEKQKEQKPAWSEEDEDILNCCISSIEEAKENRYAYKETDGDTSYDREIDWLKSIRPQPKQEWSEEDENVLKYLHDLISWGYAEKFMDAQTAHDMRVWINERLRHDTFQNGNSRPKSSDNWKPSEEQMEWLESAVKLSTDKPHIHGIIISLYEQLKRL